MNFTILKRRCLRRWRRAKGRSETARAKVMEAEEGIAKVDG